MRWRSVGLVVGGFGVLALEDGVLAFLGTANKPCASAIALAFEFPRSVGSLGCELTVDLGVWPPDSSSSPSSSPSPPAPPVVRLRPRDCKDGRAIAFSSVTAGYTAGVA